MLYLGAEIALRPTARAASRVRWTKVRVVGAIRAFERDTWTDPADDGHQVLLIESGRTSYSRDVQRLGDTVGNDVFHAPMSVATRRQIGGTSNLWSGRCVPFDPVDFQQRKIVGDARWPVSYAELERYFPRA